ncbi:hypothetical protein IFM89_035722 [Coptis chinensis]|uniref:FBD domain-containing protein n=1 Tax=Coptis chinensis TaxID=261450 RepID=A0A835LCK9_9MAGN|nr:hypothetical protein IFM89_035722 [Coptis chinensis]
MAKLIFMNFVDNVLLHHDTTFIDKFWITGTLILDDIRVIEWISTVSGCQVQELVLDIMVKRPLLFPCTLFTFESLKRLKLHVDSILKFPAQFFMSSLKVVNIYAPALKNMTFDDFYADDDIYDCEIKIHAESLITLDWKSNFAYKDAYHGDRFGTNGSWTLEAIPQPFLPHLEVRTLKVLSRQRTALKVSLRGTLWKLQWILIIKGLTNRIHASAYIFPVYAIWMPTMEIGLELMVLGHLKQFLNLFCHTWKSVELSSFDGNKKELGLVGFLLKNARAILKVTIRSSSTLSANPKKKIVVLKQLLMLPRVSTCVIDIY